MVMFSLSIPCAWSTRHLHHSFFVCYYWCSMKYGDQWVWKLVKTSRCARLPSVFWNFECSLHDLLFNLRVVHVSLFSDESCSSEIAIAENDMDDLLLECFLMAIKSLVKPNDLPLLTNVFYGSLMMRVWWVLNSVFARGNRSLYSPSDLILDVKKSSYKKVYLS